MQTGWLLRDGQVLAAADLADSFVDRTRGLLGKKTYDGAMVLPRTRSIHSFGVRFPVDVAFLDKEMKVVAMVRLSQWRITMPRLRANQALEAKAGSFDRWGLRLGGHSLELRPAPGRGARPPRVPSCSWRPRSATSGTFPPGPATRSDRPTW